MSANFKTLNSTSSKGGRKKTADNLISISGRPCQYVHTSCDLLSFSVKPPNNTSQSRCPIAELITISSPHGFGGTGCLQTSASFQHPLPVWGINGVDRCLRIPLKNEVVNQKALR